MRKRTRRIPAMAGAVLCLSLLMGACGQVETSAVEADRRTTAAAINDVEIAAAETDGAVSETEAVRIELNLAEEETGEEVTEKYAEQLADEEYCRENRIYRKETASPDEITLVFAGDILFDESYAVGAALKSRGRGIEGGIAADMLEELRGADIFMVNNEFPYTNRGTPTPGKTFTFRARPEYASYLFDMGADIVSLANNHAYDYGEVSLTDTLDTLNQIGMPFVGAGRNIEEASKPVYFVANDKKIAFVSATQIERLGTPDTKGATEDSPGVFRCLDPTRLLGVIAEAKENSDYVVVYIHWGTEGTDVLDHWQKEQAPLIAEAGADLIIGDHPHVLQPIGYVGDVPVVYSLGNFFFNSKTRDTGIVKVTLDEEGLKSLQFIPGVQKNCSVSKADGTEKTRIIEYMQKISTEISMDEEGFVTKRAE